MPELHLANRVKELTTTEGTGAVALEGALDGHQSFADSPITDGQTVAYAIRHRTIASEWEVGYGTFDATAGTLSRDTVLESPTDAKINFSSGDKIVFVGHAAEEILLEGTAESISSIWDFAGGLNVGGVLLADGVGDIQDARVPVTAVTQHEAAIDHGALLNFVANEHVDHSAVVLTAGDGLKGGGDISASRTLNIEPADFAGAFLADDGLDNLEVLLAADGSLEDDGTGAIRVDATGITVGTLADARLSANVALLDRAAQEFTGAENYFTGGNVGIGTSVPTALLDVDGGSVQITGADDVASTVTLSPGADTGAAGTPSMQLVLPDGSASAPSLRFASFSTGLSILSGSQLVFSIDGNEVMRIDGGGDVSIGDTSDASERLYLRDDMKTARLKVMSSGHDVSLRLTDAAVVDYDITLVDGTSRLEIGAGPVSITNGGILGIPDGVTAPGARTGVAQLFVDSADGDLKVIFGDGTVKTLATDT